MTAISNGWRHSLSRLAIEPSRRMSGASGPKWTCRPDATALKRKTATPAGTLAGDCRPGPSAGSQTSKACAQRTRETVRFTCIGDVPEAHHEAACTVVVSREFAAIDRTQRRSHRLSRGSRGVPQILIRDEPNLYTEARVARIKARSLRMVRTDDERTHACHQHASPDHDCQETQWTMPYRTSLKSKPSDS